ncbi:uncharacterized protein LOC136089406 isoform X2 [Hydra vulgaris]|uniref:Uncharacterized protein LOC136089406 isoform X2 n=1 Tax=Hydra vulgaris TaxID=6087 RepID=A0ABM4DAS9_HYDVU
MISNTCNHLKNLLLENNKLSSLPLELGYLTSLTGLNLSNNPLLFPPKHVIEIGVKGILKFLQEKLHYQDSAKNCHFDDNDCKDEMMYSSQLVSPDIRESFEDQSLKHFCNDKMVITEKSNKERGLNKQKESHQSNQQTSKKKKNLNDKDCNINSMTHIEKIKFQKEDSLKKIRNNEILSNWRTKKKVKRKEIQTLTPIIKINMPYGNDLPSKCSKNTVSSKKANELLKIEINTNSSQNPIEQQIHEHVKKLKLSNQSAFLLDANEALKRAEDNLNEALNLQKELERNRSLEYRFKAFFT